MLYGMSGTSRPEPTRFAEANLHIEIIGSAYLYLMKVTDPAQLSYTPRQRVRRAFGWLGVAMSLPFFVWLALGLIPAIPSMVDVFGVPGLRTPAAITIGGLLLGAFGFHET